MFQAWVSSTAASDPDSTFIHGTGKYIRPDGTVIAVNWTDLTDGTLANSIFHDETGKAVSGPAHAWTATAPDGGALGPNCAVWTDGNLLARTGVVGAKSGNWSSFAADPCTNSYRLYCFEK